MPPSPTITDNVPLGGIPNRDLRQPNVPLTADLTRQYVVGRPEEALYSFLRALPLYIDDTTRDFGPNLYERMLTDSHVASNVAVLKASILEDGITLAPAKPDEADDGHALSVEIRDAAERMFEELADPLDDALWSMGDAIATGNKIAELEYRFDSTYTGRTILVLNRIAPKPRNAVALVVDPFNTIVGFSAMRPGLTYTTLAGMYIHTPEQAKDILPREKFAVLTHRPKDGHPLGTSILRPAYNPWWLKQQTWGDYLAYLRQFAAPSIIGNTAPEATGMQMLLPDGTLGTPQEYMKQQLLNFRNSTVAVFPYAATAVPMEVQGNGEAFARAFALCNAAITEAILTQSLATEQGDRHSGTASTVHKDVLDTIVRQGKRMFVRMLRYQVLRPWVRWNWGDAAVALTPLPNLGATEEEDFSTKATAVASLVRYGFLHKSQYVALDSELGMPPRDPEWEKDEPPAPAVLPAPGKQPAIPAQEAA